jgi:bifunctional non-homologous end joining protein LigD
MPRKQKASDSLSEYRAKRDFKRTPEPVGKPSSTRKRRPAKLRFCVQKHLASRLHYDLRLEHNGTLLSWAIPKGPSLNPKDKRLAVRTEDHPVEYLEFEGVIPDGYGAGIMMLWDRGTWRPEVDDVDAALKKGDLKFMLDGVKLKQSWVLIRTRGYGGTPNSWLLIKHRDAYSGDLDITAAAPLSVKTDRDFPEIFRDTDPEQAESLRRSAGKVVRQVIAQADKPPAKPPARRRRRARSN